MVDIQNEINRLSILLRVQVIESLVKEDRIKYGAKPLDNDEMNIVVCMISKIKCNTKLLRKLFANAHEMHEEKGMMPHAVTVGDLEWCIKYRSIGYNCCQRVKHSWLVAKEDEDLRRLPAFRELAKIYAPMVKMNKPLLPPVDKSAITNEAMKIVNQIGFAEA